LRKSDGSWVQGVSVDNPNIINIGDLLVKELVVPEYQRPYKWTDKNCNELFFDIKNALNANKSAYRLGNVITHTKDDNKFDIVDGQQRIISLLLLLKEFGESKLPDLKVVHNKHTLVNLKRNRKLFASLVKEQFKSDESKKKFIDYLLNKCQVVFMITKCEYQAFQMFDSQNSRGKELDPRDLLKAYHLREISPHVSYLEKMEIDKKWVNNTDKINALLSRVLYPIKAWAKGENGIDPLKYHIDEFKGISRFDKLNKYHNYARPSIYVRNYVEDYNSENMTNISYNVMSKMEYPFQLTGEILNGETFFEMIFHYCELLDKIAGRVHRYKKEKEEQEQKTFEEILTIESGKDILAPVLNKYEQNYYKFSIRLFYNLLLVYTDRFGIESEDYKIVIEKMLKYSRGLRSSYASLREISYLNFAVAKDNRNKSFENQNVCSFILNCKSIKDFMKFNIAVDNNGEK
jgi:hypothetical protein